MTPQESARTKSVWAAKVVALFVVFGGLVGGAVVGVVFPLITIVTHWPPRFDPTWLFQFPAVVMLASLYGVAIGFPSSIITGAAYVVVLRRRWPLVLFGVAASATWGALLAELLSSLPTPIESYLSMGAMFAVCGLLATLACFWLVARWKLHRPA
jgi:hypothetical protein